MGQEKQTTAIIFTLIKKRALEHLLSGFCERLKHGVKIACYDENKRIILLKEEAEQAKRIWSNICHTFRNDLGGDYLCEEYDTCISEKFLTNWSLKEETKTCSPLGMIDLAAPIKVHGRTLGVVIAGQRLIAEEAETVMQNIYKKYPFGIKQFELAFGVEKNKKEYSCICTQKEIDSLLEELKMFASLIAELCEEVEDKLNLVKNLQEEKNKGEVFLERAAHSLSLPMQSVLVLSSNLVKELDVEDALSLFNEVQGLELVVENILHGSGTETIQGKEDFRPISLFEPIRSACEMFRAEAVEKGCDIKILINIGNVFYKINSEELGDPFIIVRKTFISYCLGKLEIDKNKFFEKNKIKARLVNKLNEEEVKVEEICKRSYEIVKTLKHDELKSCNVIIEINNYSIKLEVEEVAKFYLPKIDMNPRVLGLAFKNVLHNAVKYSYRTTPKGNRRYVSVRCYSQKNTWKIIISNYGVGITDVEISEGKIWLSRYRGYLSQDRNRTGAGIGLAIVKWAVEKIHGGTVTCKCKPLDNAYLTSFIVELPVSIT